MGSVPYKFQRGTASTSLAGGSISTITVTFPMAFASTPNVVVTLYNNSGWTDNYYYTFSYYIRDVATGSFKIILSNMGVLSYGTVTAEWVAMA